MNIQINQIDEGIISYLQKRGMCCHKEIRLWIKTGTGNSEPKNFLMSPDMVSLRLQLRRWPSKNRQSTVRWTFGLFTCLRLSATTWWGSKVWCITTSITGLPAVSEETTGSNDSETRVWAFCLHVKCSLSVYFQFCILYLFPTLQAKYSKWT